LITGWEKLVLERWPEITYYCLAATATSNEASILFQNWQVC
jgi:hypothetical protein